jgi:hypothetical protein
MIHQMKQNTNIMSSSMGGSSQGGNNPAVNLIALQMLKNA